MCSLHATLHPHPFPQPTLSSTGTQPASSSADKFKWWLLLVPLEGAPIRDTAQNSSTTEQLAATYFSLPLTEWMALDQPFLNPSLVHALLQKSTQNSSSNYKAGSRVGEYSRNYLEEHYRAL